MTKKENRTKAYSILSNAVQDIGAIEGIKSDLIIHNLFKMLEMQKIRLRSLAPNAKVEVVKVIKDLPNVKPLPKKELAPNGSVIADSSDSPIVEEVKLKSRLTEGDYKAVADLSKQGLDVHQISERLAIELNSVQRGIDKIK